MNVENFKEIQEKMDFEGIQRRCQTSHCHCKQDFTRSVATNKQAKEEIIHDFVKGNVTKNQGVIESNLNHFECLHCKMLLKQANSFLKNVEDLDKNEWRSICDHCREIKSTNQCRRCSYLVSQFRKGKENCQDSQKWEDMLNKVKLFLDTLTINECCVDSFERATDSEDLAKRFELTHTPSISRVVVTESSDLDIINYKNTWKYLHNVNKVTPKTSDICLTRTRLDLIPQHSEEKRMCICQKLAKISENLSLDTITEGKPLIKINSMDRKKTDDVNVTSSPPPKGLNTSKKIIKMPRDTRKIEKKSGKVKANADSELFIQMILKEQKNRNRSKAGDQSLHNLRDRNRFEGYLRTEIDELPPLPVKIFEQTTDEESASVVHCRQSKFSETTEFIQHNKIITQERNNKQLNYRHRLNYEPLFFEVQHDFSHTTENILDDNIQKKIEHHRISEHTLQPSSTKSPAKYQLSNRRYIEDGHTILPAFKIMRRMKLYKMLTTISKFDWLEKYKDQKHMSYSSGERLFEISDDGQIRWYYKDGCLALHFCNVKDEFLIYDSVQLRKTSSQPKNNLLLACFDKMGHGIVYDRKGIARLKYNQCEGIILDENVGPTARWKWNNLNEPPELRHTFEESYDPIDNCLKNQTKGTVQNEVSSNIFDKEMYTIELDSYVKETFSKKNAQFKQYQIKFKVLKINEHFTLKIIEQSKIFLLFIDGEINFKLNLGMSLVSNEIIGVKTVDFCDVVTPYDDSVNKNNKNNIV